mgnify:FL=1
MGLNVSDLLTEKCFIFNGKASTDFRLICSGGGTYGAPKRAYDTVQIPGRNGSLLIDKGYYNDTEVTYDSVGFIPEEFYPFEIDQRLAAVREWLFGPIGYKRLEDTWHPDEYRMAYISQDFSPSMVDSLEAGMVNIKFNCKPQRFLKYGEIPVVIKKGLTLFNPTSFVAFPIIMIEGKGTVTIQNEDGTFRVTVESDATVDCDMMNVYHGTENLNSKSTFSLPSEVDKMYLGKKNVISYSDSITKLSIIPRWWRL